MKLLVWLAVLMGVSEGSRVLMVLPLGSSSHKNIIIPLAEALGSRGHQVIVASLHASPANSSRSYTDLVASDAWETIRKVTGDFNVFKMREANGGKDVNSEVMKKVLRNLPEYCDAFLRDPGVQTAWTSKPDLILLPAFMNECGLALVHKFKAPFIYVTTSGLTPWTADLMGNPENPSYIPNQYLTYGAHMSLWQRTVNTLVRIAGPYLRKQLVMNRLDGVVQRFLGDPSVSLSEVEKNVSLVLVNSHYSLGHPRPMLPNVVEVGGMHCRPGRPLQDAQLRHFLDSSTVPVVLFSLGSSIRSEQLPPRVLHSLMAAFRRLPYRVLWKWGGGALSDLPANVMTRPWLPQQDVLAHKRVRAFFTHGGLLSLQEAVYHNVPLVGLPIMSDQHLNVRQAVASGVAVELSLDSLTEEGVYQAIRSVVEEKQYRQRVMERSQLLRHQQSPPLDTAVYWAEHVLRYGGGQHLRSAAVDMPLYQYLLLDVAAFLLTLTVLLLLLLRSVLTALKRLFVRVLKNTVTKALTTLRTHVKLQ
nr:UDP-glucosyltransferase 2-like [Cherax quadricarinatus]